MRTELYVMGSCPPAHAATCREEEVGALCGGSINRPPYQFWWGGGFEATVGVLARGDVVNIG